MQGEAEEPRRLSIAGHVVEAIEDHHQDREREQEDHRARVRGQDQPRPPLPPRRRSRRPQGGHELGRRVVRPEHPRVDQGQHQHHDHQDDRERGRLRVVALDEELRLDHVPDHRRPRSAEHLRVDVVAGRGHEGQHDRGEDPRDREGDHDPPERLPPARVEVLGSDHELFVDPVERDEERESREREVVVRDARDDCSRCREDLEPVRQQPEVLERAEDHAVVGEEETPLHRSDDERNEEGREDQEQERGLPAARVERDPVRHRVGDEERDHGHRARIQDRSDQELPAVGDRIDVVGELPREMETAEEQATALQGRVDRHPERDEEEGEEPDAARHGQCVRHELALESAPGPRHAAARTVRRTLVDDLVGC